MKKNIKFTRETLQQQIVLIHGYKVMLDSTLADMYRVETKILTRAVKRNLDRFPKDFMFTLSAAEWTHLRCQIGTSSEHGERRYRLYVFTEQGVAMLSSVINSPRAIAVNIAIMRTFVQSRAQLGSQGELGAKLAEIERRLENQDDSIAHLFEAMRQLLAPPGPDHGREVGFHTKLTPSPSQTKAAGF